MKFQDLFTEFYLNHLSLFIGFIGGIPIIRLFISIIISNRENKENKNVFSISRVDQVINMIAIERVKLNANRKIALFSNLLLFFWAVIALGTLIILTWN